MTISRDFFQKHFANPLTAGLDLDSDESLEVHRRIIEQNPLLKDHYLFVYRRFRFAEQQVKDLPYPSLEIGSGGGFLKEILPDVITSDVAKAEGIDRMEDVLRLSFPDRSIKAVYANGVLHHLEDCELAIRQIERVLVPGGLFVCNEPSSSPFGYFMNRHFHKEHTDRNVRSWSLRAEDGHGRLTGANMALPYIVFIRDRKTFEEKFPSLKIASVVFHDFLRYTLSGGLSYRPFVPPVLYGLINGLETAFRPFMPVFGNAMLITIKKV